MANLVLLSISEQIGRLTLNRPEVLNAMNRELFAEFEKRLDEAARDESLRVLVIAGNGRAFCAGTDLCELDGITAEAAGDLALLENQVMNSVADFSWPTIGAIHGYALGGGCELALACDFRLAAESAQFGQPEIDMGWVPAAGGSFRLPDLVGRSRAIDLILTGRRIGAVEAEKWGLVQRVVADANLPAEANKLARTLCAKEPAAVKHAMRILAERRGREEGVDLEAIALADCATRPEAQRRVREFIKSKGSNDSQAN